jgi:hypothetical protein
VQPHDPYAQPPPQQQYGTEQPAPQAAPQAQYMTGQPAQYAVSGQPTQYAVSGQPMVGMFPATQATLALVLACLSWISCGCFLSIPAVILASSALEITKVNPGHPDHGTANAANIVGWINIGVTIVGGLIYAVIIFALIGGEGGF